MSLDDLSNNAQPDIAAKPKPLNLLYEPVTLIKTVQVTRRSHSRDSNSFNLISLQPPRNTQFSSVVTLARTPRPTHSSLKITSRSFRYASPHLWNQLPHSLCQPRLDLPLPDSPYFHDHLTSSASPSPLLSSITPISNLKTFLFLKSYPP